MQKKALIVSGVVFFLIALAHLLRVVFQLNALIGDVEVPLWLSAVAAVVMFLLAWGMFRAVR